MKNYSVRLFLVGLAFLNACSKNDEIVEAPQQAKLDLLTTISNSWDLYMYILVQTGRNIILPVPI